MFEFLVFQEGMVVNVELENLANLEQWYVWYQDINTPMFICTMYRETEALRVGRGNQDLMEEMEMM